MMLAEHTKCLMKITKLEEYNFLSKNIILLKYGIEIVPILY